MFLRREEPQQIATAYPVASIAYKICAGPTGYEVKFELHMRVFAISAGSIAIAPDGTIECSRKLEALMHDDKKR